MALRGVLGQAKGTRGLPLLARIQRRHAGGAGWPELARVEAAAAAGARVWAERGYGALGGWLRGLCGLLGQLGAR